MILQGDPFNLQGSAPSVQGGATATALQPAASPQPAVGIAPRGPANVFYRPNPNDPTVYNAQGQALSYDQFIAQGGKADFSNVMNAAIPGMSPVSAPQPMQTSVPIPKSARASVPLNAPTSAPSVQGGATFYKPDPNSQQVYNAQGQPLSYEQYIAEGGRPDFSNVVAGQVPSQGQPAATGTIGQASQGVLPVPTTPPATPASADPNQTRIGELSKQLFSSATAPSQQKLYEDAYNASGLAEIKTRLTDLNSRIADLNSKFTAKEGDINENPFLSEASRVGRLKRLNDQRVAEVGNLLAEYKQYADLYNQGVEEINNSVTRQVGDFNTTRQIGTEELNYLLGIEKTAKEDQATKRTIETDARKFALDNNITKPFYTVDGRTIIRTSDGRAYSSEAEWLADGGKPELVQQVEQGVNLKDYPASYQEYLLAKQDGFAGTYNDYQNLDANRKISIARAGAAVVGNSGLNSKEAAIFNGIVDKYNKSPLIAAADKMKGYLSTIEAAGQGQSTPQKDLNLIYAYIKALDYGDSAVREGEINLGMDTGSIKQQLNAKIQKLSGGGLLDPSQRQNYISAARELINSVNAAARAKESSFASQAQVTGVGDAWNQFRGAIQTSYDQPATAGGASNVDLNDLF